MLRTGVHILDFLRHPDLGGQWDVIVFDPPYWDDSLLPTNGGSISYKQSKSMRSEHQGKRFMSPVDRINILKEIILRSSPKVSVIDFYNAPINPVNIESLFSFLKYSCQHVWVKPIKYSMTGSTERHNGEYITIYSNHKFPRKHTSGHTLSKFLPYRPPERKTSKGEHIARTAAKPKDLYIELFKHLDAKNILDPFAGHGGSIRAARELGIHIDACDIDNTLEWGMKTITSWF